MIDNKIEVELKKYIVKNYDDPGKEIRTKKFNQMYESQSACYVEEKKSCSIHHSRPKASHNCGIVYSYDISF